MQDVKIAAAQFQPAPTDKQANLEKIADLTAQAAKAGAEIVCFQEQSITGYSLWAFGADTRERDDNPAVVEDGRIHPAWNQPGTDPYPLAETVPDGPSCQRLIEIAKANGGTSASTARPTACRAWSTLTSSRASRCRCSTWARSKPAC